MLRPVSRNSLGKEFHSLGPSTENANCNQTPQLLKIYAILAVIQEIRLSKHLQLSGYEIKPRRSRRVNRHQQHHRHHHLATRLTYRLGAPSSAVAGELIDITIYSTTHGGNTPKSGGPRSILHFRLERRRRRVDK